MSSELRDRINEGAEMAREAIRRVIEIHGLGSLNEEVKSFPVSTNRGTHTVTYFIVCIVCLYIWGNYYFLSFSIDIEYIFVALFLHRATRILYRKEKECLVWEG